MKTLEVTLLRPGFEVRRSVERHAVFLKQDHHPASCRFIPEDLWIPGVVRACLAVAVKDWITRKVSKRSSIIGAVGNALHLLMREAVEGCVHQHKRIFPPPGVIVTIDET